MLLKRVIIKRGIIDDFTNPVPKTIAFRRVPGINKCYDFNPGCEKDWEINHARPYTPDPRCKYQDNCTLRYTCRKINNDPKYYNSFKGEYIPTV